MSLEEQVNLYHCNMKIIKLKDRVFNILSNAFDEDTKITINSSEFKISGTILSNIFESMSPSERQDYIFELLDLHLNKYEINKISFICALTFKENETLND